MKGCRQLSLVVLLFLLPQSLIAAFADKRALVIGNANYSVLPTLENTVNDANDIAIQLEKLGFEVDLLLDASHLDMQRGVSAFSSKLDSDTISLVYYAGHGVQEQGVNYLIPATANIQQSWQLKSSTMSLDTILNALDDSLSPLKIVMLDACRDNPFKDDRRLSRSIRAKAGLAQFVSTSGTILSYATAPDRVAYDGDPGDMNSPYTTALLEHITTPGIKVGEMLNRVGKDVRQSTAGLQEPWQSSSPIDDFCFAGCLDEPGQDSLDQELDRIVSAFRFADYELLAERLNLSAEQTERLVKLFDEYESISVSKSRSVRRSTNSQTANISLELEQAVGLDGRVVVPGPRWNTIELIMRQSDGRWRANDIENEYLLPLADNRVDVRAPNIVIDVSGVAKESLNSVRIQSDVLDNKAVNDVRLYYRDSGSNVAYSTIDLRKDDITGRYVALVDTTGATSGNLEIYLEATDAEENLTRWPAPRSPLLIRIETTAAAPLATKQKSNNKKWLWIGLGVLAAGLAASAASDGGSGGDDDRFADTRPVTVTIPLP